MKLTEKKSGKSYLDKQTRVLPVQINCMVKYLYVELTANVVIYLKSSSPLIGTFFATFKLKMYVPGDTYVKVVWSIFKTSESGVS